MWKLIAFVAAGLVALGLASGCGRRQAEPAPPRSVAEERGRDPEVGPRRRRARPAPKPTRDLLTLIRSTDSLRTFGNALEASGLDKELAGPGPFTLLAPSDEAFAKLPAGELEQLLKPESKEKLRARLSHHVLPGKVMAEDLADLKSAQTLSGTPMQVKTEQGMIVVDGALVVQVNVEATNGVIHVVDALLKP